MENEIPTTAVAEQPKKGVGITVTGWNPKAYYGERFDGKFMRVDELAPNMTKFKEFYLNERLKNFNTSRVKIVRMFNETIAPEKFFPYPTQLTIITRRFEKEVAVLAEEQKREDKQKRKINRLIEIKGTDDNLVKPPDQIALDMGARTLGGLLINDAVDAIQDDDEDLTPEMKLKKKTYALNVFAQVNRQVQGKAELDIKRAGERREQNNFLMEALNKAAAGQITPEELASMRASLEIPTVVPAVITDHVDEN